eukprot:1947695-Pleurochrysis_carterae.AAC.2
MRGECAAAWVYDETVQKAMASQPGTPVRAGIGQTRATLSNIALDIRATSRNLPISSFGSTRAKQLEESHGGVRVS